jgi:hypothetical protein
MMMPTGIAHQHHPARHPIGVLGLEIKVAVERLVHRIGGRPL